MFSFLKKKVEILTNLQIEETLQDYENIMPITEYFKDETGITFEKQLSILKNKVTTFCKRRDINSFSNLLNNIKVDTTLKQELIDYLTTNETFFYREYNQIRELTQLTKNSTSKVDILCAPCATGEEPYSIAISFLEAGISKKDFNIVAIDINQDAINKAKEAIYKDRNVRNLSPQIIEKYFIKEADIYILKDSIKENVDFKLLNIFDSSFSCVGKFDYIFSRNMLIYFDKETKIKAKHILENLRKDKNQEVFFGHADLF